MLLTYACPYHYPTATMGHLIHNVNVSKSVTHMTPHMLSALNSKNWDLSVKGTLPQNATQHQM